MEIVYKKTMDLIPYVNNTRTHSDKQVSQIASSIKEFGFTNPILIDAQGGIIAGHGRLMAANKLKMQEVPCIVLDGLTEAQKKAYIIADNKLALNAGWDEELLKLELENLKELDFDIDLLGFDADELDSLLNIEPEEVIEDDFEMELPEEPKSKRGDIWLLGRHRLMCGDSTSQEDVNTLMDGNKSDMLLTDPPYNVAYEGKTKDALTIQNDKMENDQFRTFLKDAFATANEVLKAGGVFYIWHADSEGYNFRGACFDVGWKVRQCLIWNKNSMVMGRQDYHWKHEPCLYGWKEGAGHLWASDRTQTTILDFNRPTSNKERPTMKPVTLFDYQIKNNTKGNDIVLDLFAGSGTTIMACEQNGRNGYGMELDEKYVDVIVDRYIKFKESDSDVKLLRDGKEYTYKEIKEMAL